MENILEIKDLSIGYGEINIVRDVTFPVKKGEVLGIVGESGCGKSTLLSSILQLSDYGSTVKKGQIIYNGKDLLSLNNKEWRTIRGEKIGVIFQNPGSSLNPLIKIGKQFYETMRSHMVITKEEAKSKILETFELLSLDYGEHLLSLYPHELSGGMSQRVAIALTLVLNPDIIIADEPTSALDVTVQVQVVNNLIKLKEEFGTTIIIVTHNMGVIAKMADNIGVMYHGSLVEYGETKSILHNPCHPYTKALLGAIPRLMGSIPVALEGRAPEFRKDETGCSFRERCRYCSDGCKEFTYIMKETENNHMTCCDKARF